MFHLETFVLRGHQKMIDHYRWLRDTARSEEERERFRRRMMKEYGALRSYTEHSRAAHNGPRKIRPDSLVVAGVQRPFGAGGVKSRV
jgi:hypothetical protein